MNDIELKEFLKKVKMISKELASSEEVAIKFFSDAGIVDLQGNPKGIYKCTPTDTTLQSDSTVVTKK